MEARPERLCADGGALLLRELLHRLGLGPGPWLSERLSDPRDPARTTHPTEETVDLDEGHREHRLTTEEREELRQLRREDKRLRMEREILARAPARF